MDDLTIRYVVSGIAVIICIIIIIIICVVSGKKGKDGLSGLMGPTGPPGLSYGPEGPEGSTGPTGPTGMTGAVGLNKWTTITLSGTSSTIPITEDKIKHYNYSWGASNNATYNLTIDANKCKFGDVFTISINGKCTLNLYPINFENINYTDKKNIYYLTQFDIDVSKQKSTLNTALVIITAGTPDASGVRRKLFNLSYSVTKSSFD